MLKRLRALPERWAWLREALAVQRRFGEVRGGQLAASITLASFVSIFPLLLVGIAVIGFFSANAADFPAQVIDKLGLTGEAADTVTTAINNAEKSAAAASVLGVLGLLWSGLGLVAATQDAYNSVWQVKGRGMKDKGVGLAWLVGAGLIFVASFAVTAGLQLLPGFLAPLAIVVGLAVDFGLFLWSSKLLPNRDVPWRALVPGAVMGAIGLEVLKALGSLYVPRAVGSASAMYGSIGVVFAILAWLFFFARLIVYSAVLNVVQWEDHHGTVTVELEAPRLPGSVPLETTRGGQVNVEA